MFAGLMSRWMSPAAWASDERAAGLPQETDDAPRRQRPVEGHELLEVQAAQQLHGVIEDAVRRAAVVVDRDRARMRQARGQLHLALEARERALALGAGREQLDGGRPPQQRVPRFPDDAHRSAPEAAHEPVGPDLLPLAASAAG